MRDYSPPSAALREINRSPGKSARRSALLPVGVQIIGPYLGDCITIAFAELLEREFGGFPPPWPA